MEEKERAKAGARAADVRRDENIVADWCWEARKWRSEVVWKLVRRVVVMIGSFVDVICDRVAVVQLILLFWGWRLGARPRAPRLQFTGHFISHAKRLFEVA